MLPSSGYTRLNTVRSSLNLAHVIDGILGYLDTWILGYSDTWILLRSFARSYRLRLERFNMPSHPPQESFSDDDGEGNENGENAIKF